MNIPQYRIHGQERRELKKQLSLSKNFLKILPRLIDCSEVYGDSVFTISTQEMRQELKNKILKLEESLSEPYDFTPLKQLNKHEG